MLLIDDILLFPARGVGWLVEQVRHAAQQELENESDNLRAELGDLYMMLETHQITEEEFTAREATLLDRLTRLEEEDKDADDEPETNL
jgi:ribosomal protein L29